MKDQKVYLISNQEERVALPLLTAIQLSERLGEFVTNLMKLRAVLKTSLLLLLELKSYPVNCPTPVLHVVVKFCKAKVALDGVRFRVNNFMSTTEERSYWTSFLWRWLDASAIILQVARDLGIQSLIQVIYLVHEPRCAGYLKPASVDLNLEERRLLLSTSSVGSRKLRGPGHQIVRPAYPRVDDGVEAKFRGQQQCLPGFALAEKFGVLATLLLGNFTCYGPANAIVRHRESPGAEIRALPAIDDAEQCESENGSNSQVAVMSLSELMRLETVVEIVKNADNLQDVASRVANKFDACMISDSVSRCGSRHVQAIKTHKLSKSWSYTAYSNQSPVKGASETPAKKEVRFQISPEEHDAPEHAESQDSNQNTEDAESTIVITEQPSDTPTCTTGAKIVDETYTSLGIKKGKKQALVSGLKAAAKTFGLGNRKNRLWGTKCPKQSRPHLYASNLSN
ncbi:hypothetical protein AXG93_4751s1220 [Marchantia polymorpha subsp. ruderalis]|nr:hypothetical protein AXG93_4751s1220 [Marchantia polymorpha subsp. ruderalis]